MTPDRLTSTPLARAVISMCHRPSSWRNTNGSRHASSYPEPGVHFWYQRPSATTGSPAVRSKVTPSTESAHPMRWTIPASAREIPV